MDSRLVSGLLAKHEGSLSQNGFLPPSSPMGELPDSRYSAWEFLAIRLPSLIKTGQIREAVEECPILSAKYLCEEEAWRRAYVILTYVAHAYIWGGTHPAEVLPPQISVPLLEVSSHLSLPPVLTAAAANLWNFCSATPTCLSSIEPLISFTRTPTESWFLAVGVAVEAHGGAVIQTLFTAMKAANMAKFEAIVDCFEKLAEQIDEIATILARLPEKCDPTTFYHEVRPFYAGTKNMADVGLPRGVFFDTGERRGEWKQLRGGSNGQSSLFPLIDISPGIRHNSAASGNKAHGAADDNYYSEILNYMPREHRELLLDFARLWNLQDIVGAAPDEATAQALRTAHATATAALARFRSKHIQIVSRYIIVPSRKASPEANASEARNLATMYRGKPEAALMGTSGTELIPFLKQARQQTLLASTQYSQ